MILKTGILNDCDFIFMKKHTEICTYGIWVNCGSQDDVEGRSGTAHLLEHFILNSKAATSIMNNGGTISALTEREKTIYICQIPNSDEMLFTDFLSYLKKPRFSDTNLQYEKNSIINEYKKIHIHEISPLINGLYKIMFPHNGIGNPVIGNPACFKQINIDDLVCFHKMHYQSSKMFVMQLGSAINTQYSPNDNIFAHKKIMSNNSLEINTTIPKFRWQISPDDNNIYLLAMPLYHKDSQSRKILAFIAQLFEQIAWDHYAVCDQTSFLRRQLSFQAKSYDNVGIIFTLIAGNEEICKSLFKKLREMIRFLYNNGFSEQYIQEISAKIEKINKLRLTNPFMEIYKYLNDFRYSNSLAQLRINMFNLKPETKVSLINTYIKNTFMTENMHYYTICRENLYSLPYIIYL